MKATVQACPFCDYYSIDNPETTHDEYCHHYVHFYATHFPVE